MAATVKSLVSAGGKAARNQQQAQQAARTTAAAIAAQRAPAGRAAPTMPGGQKDGKQ